MNIFHHKNSIFITLFFLSSLANFLTFSVLSFSFPFKLNGSPIITPPTLYSSAKINNNFSISLKIPFLLIVVIGVAIVLLLSLTAIPIVLSPKSRPNRVCTILSWSIKSLDLLTGVYKLKIDKKTTLKIAKLCRVRIKEHEIDELSLQLSSILDWVEQLNEVNTDNVEPLSNVSTAKLPLRKDQDSSEDKSKDILTNAPEKIENYFVVPKVVE